MTLMGGLRKGGAGEEVAVAGHDEDRGFGVGKGADGGGDAGVEGRGEVVVAGPVFEQVAEDEEARRRARGAVEEGEEGVGVGRLVFAEVKVGNEQCRKPRARGFRHVGSKPARRGRGGRVSAIAIMKMAPVGELEGSP